ncbi:hypothetical protein GF314_14280 [bacterium]|nr:hypothetical protein [bacterium]
MSTRHLARLTLAVAVAALLVSGCAHRRGIPHDASEVPGYHKPPPDLAGIDPSSLAARRILIDPGHGGHFPGAVGDDGLTEAEVNLGVALYLQGLLQWVGADVHLTRTADTDFLTPADSTLAGDLAARVAIADSLRPDVFLSIHHNSTASRDPDINETQTYYPIGRDGADRDLARSIHRQLVRALEIAPARILPGGFHVLRHAPVPAVLGEPAMISNPVIEGRLSLARSLELEARAYFLGLLDYFAAGTPRWVTDLPDTLTHDPGPALIWRFDPGAAGAPVLDPGSVRVTLDGRAVPHRRSPDGLGIAVDPRHLHGGRDLRISGRNLAGRATPARRHVRTTRDRGPWRSVFVAEAGEGPRRGLLHYDLGAPLAELGPLLLAPPGTPREGLRLPVYPGDEGWLLLDPAPDDLAERIIAEQQLSDVTGRDAGSSPSIRTLPDGVRWRMLDAPDGVWPDTPVPGGRWRLRWPWERPVAAHGEPHWPAIPVRDGEPLWLEADGAVPLLVSADGRVPGQAGSRSPEDTLRFTPIVPDLVGTRIVVDARGGGTEAQTSGPLGTRGSDLNLRLADQLAAMLRGAGAAVLLARTGDEERSDPERVARADAFGADLYLAIGRRESGPAVHHHPGSAFGRPWAEQTARRLSALLAVPMDATPAYDYVLRHTACPAIVVLLEPVGDAASEQRLDRPSWQNAVVRTLLASVVAMHDAPPVADLDWFLRATGDRGIPRDRLDYLRLDGAFTWLPAGGHATGMPVTSPATGAPGRLPLGGDRHVFELHDGPHWQVWTLTRGQSGRWQAQLFLERR